jgi:amidohydrolase
VTISTIHGGVRHNIIPDEVELTGTIRALDEEMRRELHERIRRTAEQIATASGATARVEIDPGYPITWNDPDLLRRMTPTLRAVAGDDKVDVDAHPILGAEDFAYYQKVVPGLFVLLGIRSASTPAAEFPSNHSPKFRIEEEARVLELGVRTLSHLAIDSMIPQD